MKTWKKITIAGVLITLGLAFAVYVISGNIGTQYPVISERLIIEAVKVDSNNSVSVYVKKNYNPIHPLESIHVNGAIIKDTAGNVLATDDTINAVLTDETTLVTTTMAVHYGNLPSGTYTVCLITTAGGSFLSPAFNIP